MFKAVLLKHCAKFRVLGNLLISVRDCEEESQSLDMSPYQFLQTVEVATEKVCLTAFIIAQCYETRHRQRQGRDG